MNTSPSLTGSSIGDPREWLRGFEQRAVELRDRAERAQQSLAANDVTLTSPDRLVTLTVNGGGTLLALELGAKAANATQVRLAQVILQTYQQACAKAAQQTFGIMSDLVDEDSETMAMLRKTLPPTDAR